MQLDHLTLEASGHDALAQPFEAVHLGFYQAAAVIPAPELPDRVPHLLASRHSVIAHPRTRPIALPRLRVLAGRNHRHRTSGGNRRVAGFGVVGPVRADAGNDFVSVDLLQQLGQDRRIAGSRYR